MKSKTPEYLTMESEIWRPVHAYRIDEDSMPFWGLYRVNFPGGSNRNYDYVTLSAFGNIDPVENGFSMVNDWLQKVHQGREVEAIIQQTQDARDHVWSEVFLLLDHAIPLKPAPGRFMMVNQMCVTPGREA